MRSASAVAAILVLFLTIGCGVKTSGSESSPAPAETPIATMDFESGEVEGETSDSAEDEEADVSTPETAEDPQ